MDSETYTTNGPLEGMPFRVALQRIFQFAQPAFWSTLVLGLLSLCVKGKLQGILVGAFAGLLSLTLIKLFAYVLLVAFGVSLAFNAIPLVSKPVRWLGGRMANVTFDCASTALGVLIGMVPALAIDRGLAMAGAWLVVFPLMFLFIQLLLWSATNMEQLIVRFDLPRLNLLGVQIVGVVLMIAGLLAIRHEDWQEVHDPEPRCLQLEQIAPMEAPAAQRHIG